MHPEAVFLAGYAVVLVAAAAGLESLGRRSSQPWSSRTLAASRPPDAQQRDEETNWPHSEVPVFHLGVSGVVLTAGLLLTAVSVVRHHRPIEVVVHLALLALIATRIARSVTQHRALTQRNEPRLP